MIWAPPPHLFRTDRADAPDEDLTVVPIGGSRLGLSTPTTIAQYRALFARRQALRRAAEVDPAPAEPPHPHDEISPPDRHLKLDADAFAALQLHVEDDDR